MLALVVALPGQQDPSPAGLTLSQAVEDALRNYPSVRVSQEQINAAAARIQLARTAYLPRADMLACASASAVLDHFRSGRVVPPRRVRRESNVFGSYAEGGNGDGSSFQSLSAWATERPIRPVERVSLQEFKKAASTIEPMVHSTIQAG